MNTTFSVLHRAGQFAVFGQEPIARVDCLGSGGTAGVQNRVDAEVGIPGGGATDAHRLIGHPGVQGAGIGFGIDRHRSDAHTLASADDACRYLAPICHQYLVEHTCTPETLPTRLTGAGISSLRALKII